MTENLQTVLSPELKKVEKNPNERRKQIIKKVVVGVISVGLAVSPLACRAGYAIVRLIDTIPKMHDPLQRGEVYNRAREVINQTWDQKTADVILETFDRADENKGLALDKVIPGVVASAYGLPGVDYGPVWQEWSQEDKAGELGKRSKEKLVETKSKIIDEFASVKNNFQVNNSEIKEQQSSSHISFFERRSQHEQEARDILQKFAFFGVKDEWLKNEMSTSFADKLGNGYWNNSDVDQKAQIIQDYEDEYSKLADKFQQHSVSENLRTALFVSGPIDDLSRAYPPAGLWEQIKALDVSKDKISYEEAVVLFELRNEINSVQGQTDKSFSVLEKNYLFAIRDFIHSGRTDLFSISRYLLQAENVGEQYKLLGNNPQTRQEKFLEMSQKAYDFEHSEVARQITGITSIGSVSANLRDIYMISKVPLLEFLARYCKDSQTINKGLGLEGSNLIDVWRAFPKLSVKEQVELEDVPFDYLLKSAVVSIIRNPSNYLANWSSSSTYIPESGEAQSLVDEFSQKGSTFGNDEEASTLFSAVALHIYRQRGVDERTSWSDVCDTIDIWARVVGPQYQEIIPIISNGRIELSLDEKARVLRALIEPLANSDLLLQVHELSQINSNFVWFDGNTFEGVRAQIDLQTMVLSAYRVGANTPLSENAVSFVLPWTYFVGKQDAIGLIDFAVTKNIQSEKLVIVSGDKSSDFFRSQINRNKIFFAVLENGEVLVDSYSNYVSGTEEKPTEVLLQKLEEKKVKSIFTPIVFYDSSQPTPVLGFKDSRLAQFDTTFVVVSQNTQGATRVDFIVARGKGGEGLKTLKGAQSSDSIYDPIIGEDDLMDQIKKQIGGEIKYVFFGDPGHSVFATSPTGTDIHVYAGVGETETNRIIASPISY